MKTYRYCVNHPVPKVGYVAGNGEVRCISHRANENDSEIYAKDTYSDASCAVCLKPLMFYTKVFTRFKDGSTVEDNEINTSLICGFTAKHRGGIETQELVEYSVLNE